MHFLALPAKFSQPRPHSFGDPSTWDYTFTRKTTARGKLAIPGTTVVACGCGSIVQQPFMQLLSFRGSGVIQNHRTANRETQTYRSSPLFVWLIDRCTRPQPMHELVGFRIELPSPSRYLWKLCRYPRLQWHHLLWHSTGVTKRTCLKQGQASRITIHQMGPLLWRPSTTISYCSKVVTVTVDICILLLFSLTASSASETLASSTW